MQDLLSFHTPWLTVFLIPLCIEWQDLFDPPLPTTVNPPYQGEVLRFGYLLSLQREPVTIMLLG